MLDGFLTGGCIIIFIYTIYIDLKYNKVKIVGRNKILEVTNIKKVKYIRYSRRLHNIFHTNTNFKK